MSILPRGTPREQCKSCVTGKESTLAQMTASQHSPCESVCNIGQDFDKDIKRQYTSIDVKQGQLSISRSLIDKRIWVLVSHIVIECLGQIGYADGMGKQTHIEHHVFAIVYTSRIGHSTFLVTNSPYELVPRAAMQLLEQFAKYDCTVK